MNPPLTITSYAKRELYLKQLKKLYLQYTLMVALMFNSKPLWQLLCTESYISAFFLGWKPDRERLS